jgi:predicted Zn-dependent protease
MRFLVSLLAALLVTAAGAETLPDLGDSSQAVLSAQQERQLGESIMRQIRASKHYLDDPEVGDYINNLGYRLVAQSPNTAQPFEFFLVDDSSINAFALPGGFIGVNTGLLLAAQAESEVAGVLAHEIAHVTQRHIARMLMQQKQSSVATLATLAAALAREYPGGRSRLRVRPGRRHPEPAELHARQRARGRPGGPADPRSGGTRSPRHGELLRAAAARDPRL